MSSSIIIVKSTRSETQFQLVSYKDKNYYVGYIPNKEILFVFDADDKDKVINECWRITNNYLSSNSGYLHRVIYDNLEYTGENPIDHINRIPRDNRKENLRLTSTSENVRNRDKMKRNADLPSDCGILPDDVPKNIWYAKDEGEGKNKHGERWCLEIKGLPKDNYNFKEGKFIWKSTSSRDVSLKVKLEETIQKLKELREEYPAIKLATTLENEDTNREELIKSFNDILNLSSFPKEIKEKNLVDFKSDLSSIDMFREETKLPIKTLDFQESGKKKGNNLPENCGVKKSDIPKYCYYSQASLTRGDKFVIDRHPKLLEKEKRQLSTPDSKVLTTKEKFDILLEYIHCLENDLPIVKKEYTKGKRGQFSQKDTDSSASLSSSEKKTPQKLPIEKKEKIIDLPEKTIETKFINDEFNCVPKYVYYKPSDGEHGSSWHIKSHPKLSSRNIKIKTSRTSALLTDKEKYDEILEHLHALENDLPFKKFETIRGVKNQIHKEKSNKKTPKDWDLEKYPICEYLYYQEEKGTKGDYWMVKRHPKQEKDMLFTTTSKSKTTLEKYLEALEIIKNLDEE